MEDPLVKKIIRLPSGSSSGSASQVVWVFGHTHWSSDSIINETRVVSNQCGYITTSPDGKAMKCAESVQEIQSSLPSSGWNCIM